MKLVLIGIWILLLLLTAVTGQWLHFGVLLHFCAFYLTFLSFLKEITMQRRHNFWRRPCLLLVQFQHLMLKNTNPAVCPLLKRTYHLSAMNILVFSVEQYSRYRWSTVLAVYCVLSTWMLFPHLHENWQK